MALNVDEHLSRLVYSIVFFTIDTSVIFKRCELRF